jgi:hypothetical protein
MIATLLAASLLFAATPTDAEVLDSYLTACEPNYSEEHAMLGTSFRSPGYHTRIADGTWVHTTRGSLEYAVALLARNRPGDADRAAKTIRKVMSLQETDPARRTCGIWPWLLEEPLEQMAAPDYNWADFCGAMLAQMLHDHPDRMPDGLAKQMRASLALAAAAIKRRNVGPDYTNIAIMGGGVCAAAGELLGDEPMLAYGRARLEKVVAHTAEHGSFNEFNSPTYTIVAVNECERVLRLVQDEPTRVAAESLRQTAWKVIADSFHPGTQQWAGPHGRTYADYISPATALYLSRQTGVEILPHKVADVRRSAYPQFNALPCPEALKPCFERLAADPVERRRTFVRRAPPQDPIEGVTWLSADACLGSVNESTFWTQRRPLIGYWRTDEDRAIVFRLRFLHDGRDFCSMGAAIAQSGPRALVSVDSRRNQGSWHPTLDRPADGQFAAKDLRLRCELRGQGVAVAPLGDGRFELRAGNHRAVIHTLPGSFDGQSILWRIGNEDGEAVLDAICYEGPQRTVDFHSPPRVSLVLGIELLGQHAPPAATAPEAPQDGDHAARWDPAKGVSLQLKRPG